MRKMILFILVFLLSATNASNQRNKAIEEALGYLKINPSGISFNLSYVDLDSFRFKNVNYLLQNPLETIDHLGNNALKIEDKKDESLELYLELLQIMDIDQDPPILTRKDEKFPWDDGKHLTSNVREAIDILFLAIIRGQEKYEELLSKLDEPQIDSIYKYIPNILLDSENEVGQNAEITLSEMDSITIEQNELTKRMFDMITQIPLRNVESEISASLIYASELSLKSFLKGNPSTLKSPTPLNVPGASGDILYYAETPVGKFIIGGSGRTEYFDDFTVIIDLGGNDVYHNSAGGANENSFINIAIDLTGDDLYISNRDFAFGSAFLGTGILIDCEGNDLYRTKDYSIGVGLMGTGMLWDMDGDDTYTGNFGSTGLGYIGKGILIDDDGNDTYLANLYCQGFGFVGGLGLILDKMGNDTYITQGKIPDKLRDADYSISMSQGCGFGLRPWYSGGIGILLDLEGNDIYKAELFSQGSSYWYSIGLLFDKNGTDSYEAHRYSQGTSTHMGIACLIDDGDGNDTYISGLVSQGCGHDIALGALNDRGGNDTYIVSELSQGAGNANGIGLFIDEGEDDTYIIKRGNSVQGFGNFRREYGSLGMMLDFSGNDIYSGGLGNNGDIWRNGKYGIGINFTNLKK